MRAYYEVKFQLQFRTHFATEFQSFFVAVMQRRHGTDFQQVKPYGNQGDKKSDGYQPSQKRVFQVYAPEQLTSALTLKKINVDLRGAIGHWQFKMAEWVFVHNQYRGLPPDVVMRLAFLKRCKHVEVIPWCETELEKIFFELHEADQAAILGPAPTSTTIQHVGMNDILQVVKTVAQQPAPLSGQINRVPAGKLQANGLTQPVQDLLKLGAAKARLVREFFESWNDPLLGDRIAASFKGKYLDLRGEGKVGDEVFHELWKYAGAQTHATASQESAVLALIAFLFEECEIFEPGPVQP